MNLLSTGMSPALPSPCYCKAAASRQVGFNNAIIITTAREEALAEQSPAKGGIMHAWDNLYCSNFSYVFTFN